MVHEIALLINNIFFPLLIFFSFILRLKQQCIFIFFQLRRHDTFNTFAAQDKGIQFIKRWFGEPIFHNHSFLALSLRLGFQQVASFCEPSRTDLARADSFVKIRSFDAVRFDFWLSISIQFNIDLKKFLRVPSRI